ncbi:MAG: MerR family transcriptional regulator, partial [Brevibacterium sp.]|nr:MerR family transcriptional regulator [Brevibacterium sp.]
MKLSALARETGASTASIKYYIHVGILPSGRKRNATTADYSQAHIDRLALIIWLRRELGTPIDSISALTRTIDDKALETIELMGICQRVALEASNVLISAQPAQSPAPIACPTDHERSSDVSSPAPDVSVPASDVPEPSSIENDIR